MCAIELAIKVVHTLDLTSLIGCYGWPAASGILVSAPCRINLHYIDVLYIFNLIST